MKAAMCGNYVSSLLERFGFVSWRRSYASKQIGKNDAEIKKKTALIVVDVQNDFISGSLSLSNCPSKHNGEEVVEPINKLIRFYKWDLVVYSQDWHPPDHVSFVSNAKNFQPHPDNKVDLTNAMVYDNAVFDVNGKKTEQCLWPAHCIQDSDGAKFHKKLKIVENSIIIKKGINKNVDSYSAFFDNERLSKTGLDDELKTHGITRLFICGLATDVCVNYTAFDAHSLGYETYVIKDCCRGVDENRIAEIFTSMKTTGIGLSTLTEVIPDAGEISESSSSSNDEEN